MIRADKISTYIDSHHGFSFVFFSIANFSVISRFFCVVFLSTFKFLTYFLLFSETVRLARGTNESAPDAVFREVSRHSFTDAWNRICLCFYFSLVSIMLKCICLPRPRVSLYWKSPIFTFCTFLIPILKYKPSLLLRDMHINVYTMETF